MPLSATFINICDTNCCHRLTTTTQKCVKFRNKTCSGCWENSIYCRGFVFCWTWCSVDDHNRNACRLWSAELSFISGLIETRVTWETSAVSMGARARLARVFSVVWLKPLADWMTMFDWVDWLKALNAERHARIRRNLRFYWSRAAPQAYTRWNHSTEHRHVVWRLAHNGWTLLTTSSSDWNSLQTVDPSGREPGSVLE